jgi:hypothetical protein
VVQVYDVEVGKVQWHKEAYAGGGVRSLCFAPDGKTVAAGGGVNRAQIANAGCGTMAEAGNFDSGMEAA